jgi:hypothetical protein
MDNPRATYACSQAYALFDYASTMLQLFFDHSVPATKQGTPLVDILTPPAPVSKPAPAKPAPVVKTTTTTIKKAAAITSFQLIFNHSSTTLRPSFYYSSAILLAILWLLFQPWTQRANTAPNKSTTTKATVTKPAGQGKCGPRGHQEEGSRSHSQTRSRRHCQSHCHQKDAGECPP